MVIHYGPGGFGAWPLVGGILGLVLFALLIASVVWLIIALTRPRHFVGRFPSGFAGPYGAAPPYGPPPNPALQELDIAYARGAMSREEYFRRRADLTGWTPPAGSPGFSQTPPSDPGSTPGTPAS
jgi:hypothetical protein